jgi:hypothetical protein
LGQYLGFNLVLGDRLVGWAAARVYSVEGLHQAEILDLFLTDDAIGLHPVAARHLVSVLAGFGVDAVFAASSCPATLAALESCHFRLNHPIPLLGWWGGRKPPTGTPLLTSSHAEHAFFPSPTAAEAAWAAGATPTAS